MSKSEEEKLDRHESDGGPSPPSAGRGVVRWYYLTLFPIKFQKKNFRKIL